MTSWGERNGTNSHFSYKKEECFLNLKCKKILLLATFMIFGWPTDAQFENDEENSGEQTVTSSLII
jgi:hypothetical protein